MRLWQVTEELLAPFLSSCSYSWPCPQLLPSLLCWWNCLHSDMEKQVGGLIQTGKKRGKSFCCCWFIFPDGSSLQCSLSCGYTHMDKEAGTWVESGAAETLLTLEMIPQTMLPRHKNVAITELRRCVSELTLFPDSRDKLHWFNWRRVWQQRAVIWWKADPGRSSSHCVWNSANKRERAKNVLEIGLQ